MSLTIKISPADISIEKTKLIISGLDEKKHILLRSSPNRFLFFFEKKIEFFIDDSIEEYILDEESDDYLNLNSEGVEKLSNTLRYIQVNLNSSFSFEFLWIGDETESVKKINISDFCSLIDSNSVKRSVEYVICKS